MFQEHNIPVLQYLDSNLTEYQWAELKRTVFMHKSKNIKQNTNTQHSSASVFQLVRHYGKILLNIILSRRHFTKY